MTSPGGMEVGRISIRVVPDTSKFRADLKRQLKQAIKGIDLRIPVKASVEGLREEIKKAEAEAAKSKAKMDVEVDGDGAVRETRRIRQFIQKTLGSIKTTLSLNLPASLAIVRAQMAIIQKRVQGYNIRVPMEVVGISKWLAILSAVAGLLLTIPHLIGAIGGAVAVVGGAFATLPALVAGAIASISAFAVGMNGVMDALSKAGDGEKFEEALKDLTPNAQAAARALAGMREPLSEIRKSVQQALFQDMAEPLSRLERLLPPIKRGLTGIASAQNVMIRNWLKMATSQESVRDTDTILQNVRRGFDNARNSLANFARGFKDFTVVGSSFLPGFGKSIDDVSKRFAEWTRNARETGEMQQWIQNAIDKLKQLGRITADIWVGFRNIFESLRGGEDFLDIVERLSQGFRDWSEAEETQKTLQSLARVMRVVIDAATELFGQVFRTAGEVFRELEPFLVTFAQTFATVVADALRAITPMLKDMARWLSENKAIMVPLAITIISLVTGFKLLATAARGVIAVKESFQALKAGATIIGEVGTKIGGSAKKISTALWESANSAATWVSTMTSKWREAAAQAVVHSAEVSKAWVKKTAQTAKETAVKWASAAADWIKTWAGAAKAAAVHAAKTAVAWITNIAKMVAATVAQMAVAVATWVANWVRMAATALAQAARIALAWLIAMGPIVLVIAAVVALVALIILNWDRIKNATKAAWDWVWNIIQTVVGWIVDRFTEFVGWLRGIWDGLWKFVSDIIGQARDIVSGIVDKIIGILRGIGDIVGDVVGFFEDIYNGIIGWFNDLFTWLGDLGKKILDAIGDLSSLLWDSGRQLVQGLWDGWESYFDDFRGAVVRDGNELVDNINGIFKIFSPSRVFRQIGEYLGMGLIIGMESQRAGVFRAGDEMAYAVLDGFGKPQIEVDLLSGLKDAAPAALKGVKNFTDEASRIATAQWSANLGAEEITPLEDRVLAALASGLTVELDGQKVTKSVNKTNNKDRRRS
jgi:phage-related protein